jgi:hypothetical protein
MSEATEIKHCPMCGDDKDIGKFYNSYSILYRADNPHKMCICKSCVLDLYAHYLNIYNNDKKAVCKVCDLLDVYFSNALFEAAKIQSDKNKKSIVMQIYIQKVNSMKQYQNKTSKDSEPLDGNDNTNIQLANQDMMNNTHTSQELIDKWGSGYEAEEYIAFEHKYQSLKNNYNEKTAMHTEALLIYIRYRCKEEIATARGDVKEAKEWGALADKAATNAKINPSQLSKADLTDGLSTFSELSQAIEREVDIIPILPQFKCRPNDALDFNIWCYVNYIRHLQGQPLCEYDDVYKFYDKRVQDYIKQYGDPYGIFTDDTSTKNRENIKRFLKEEDE